MKRELNWIELEDNVCINCMSFVRIDEEGIGWCDYYGEGPCHFRGCVTFHGMMVEPITVEFVEGYDKVVEMIALELLANG